MEVLLGRLNFDLEPALPRRFSFDLSCQAMRMSKHYLSKLPKCSQAALFAFIGLIAFISFLTTGSNIRKYHSNGNLQTTSHLPGNRNENAAIGNLDEVDSLPRLCNITPKPNFSEDQIPMNMPIGVGYQCAGPAYDEFAQKLMELANHPMQHGKDPVSWGRRSSLVPPNKSVLFFGNSHTRQLFEAILCQYRDDIIHANQTERMGLRGSGVWHVQLKNNTTMYCINNVPQVYNSRWKELIEASLNRSLASIDAVVLGKFNHFEDSKNTAFVNGMKTAGASKYAHFELANPPEIDDVLKEYSGPVVVVGMFSRTGQSHFLKQLEKIEHSHRANLHAIDGRSYMKVLPECASSELATNTVSACDEEQGHRCTGSHGGHADLIAWDVIEQFYRLFG